MSKMNTAPETYAELLQDDDPDAANAALELLKADWKALVLVEQGANQTLAGDLRVSISPIMRLVFQLVERDDLVRAKRILRFLLHCLPDTKLIEDVHGKVRNDARLNINKKQSHWQIQQIIHGSNALESRGINHPAAVDRSVFLRKWTATKGNRCAKTCFHPKSTKLPKKYSLIMGNKKWATVSEPSLHRSASAWQLIRVYVKLNLREKRFKLNEPWLVKYFLFPIKCSNPWETQMMRMTES